MALSPRFLTLVALVASGAASAAEVNVYTYREPGLVKPLFERFTAATGIKVNLIFDKGNLSKRIAEEGARSPADLLMTVDVARLVEAKGLGITQPIVTPAVEKAVSAPFRAADGHWFANSVRARVFYVSKDRVKDTALDYADLGNPRFKGKVCTRDGRHDYNNALIAAALVNWGSAKAEEWLKGVRDNLAKKPSGGDRDVVKDIASGLCDIGLGNTYYVGLMNADAKQKPISDRIRVVLPTFGNGGTHVNVSGVALMKHAPNKAEAIKLAEWLVGPEAQKIYADVNFEYPIVPGTPVEPFIAGFGSLKPDGIALDAIAGKRKEASELVDKVNFNAGPSS